MEGKAKYFSNWETEALRHQDSISLLSPSYLIVIKQMVLPMLVLPFISNRQLEYIRAETAVLPIKPQFLPILRSRWSYHAEERCILCRIYWDWILKPQSCAFQISHNIRFHLALNRNSVERKYLENIPNLGFSVCDQHWCGRQDQQKNSQLSIRCQQI